MCHILCATVSHQEHTTGNSFYWIVDYLIHVNQIYVSSCFTWLLSLRPDNQAFHGQCPDTGGSLCSPPALLGSLWLYMQRQVSLHLRSSVPVPSWKTAAPLHCPLPLVIWLLAKEVVARPSSYGAWAGVELRGGRLKTTRQRLASVSSQKFPQGEGYDLVNFTSTLEGRDEELGNSRLLLGKPIHHNWETDFWRISPECWFSLSA